MQVQINTDNHITNNEAFSAELSDSIRNVLAKFDSHITRVEIFLKDENSIKGGDDDKKCSIEVRLEGAKPLAVTHSGATLRDAFSGAAQKASRVVGDFLEQRKEHH